VMLQLVIPGIPVSGNHEKTPIIVGKTARGTPRFVNVPTSEANAFEQRVRTIAFAGVALARWKIPDYCRVDVWLCNLRIDRDNGCKPLFDALEGIVYAHDSRILDGRTVRMKDKEGPRIILQVRPVDGADYGFTKPRVAASASMNPTAKAGGLSLETHAAHASETMGSMTTARERMFRAALTSAFAI
jgi:hypothetical protein